MTGLARRLAVARGDEPADLVLRGGRVLSVFTREWLDADVAILQDKARIRHVHLAGKRVAVPERGYDPRQVTDQAWTNWNDLYTQERVVELGIRPARASATLQGS